VAAGYDLSRMRRGIQWVAAGVLATAAAGCGGSAHSSAPTRSSSTASPTRSLTTAATSGPTATRAPTQDWPTYHDNSARTGAVGSGPALGRVRPLWSTSVAGAVYAEPLVVGGRVIVATEDDLVYALDAASGRRLWEAQLGTPVPGTSLPCGDIDPSGITGTPVADPRSGLVYVVAYRSGFRHVLVALSAASGAVRFERPIDPPGGDYRTEQQRAALALTDARVYISYGGLFGDCGSYHGWVVGAPESAPGGGLITYEVPSANEGAIWAPSGPAADGAGNLYIATGNGSSSSFDYGNAVIRLTPELQATSFFAPTDAGTLNTTDSDLGSTGPVLLPGSRAFIIGKSGAGYLLSSRDLGGIGHALVSIGLGAAFGGDAYAAGTLFLPTTSGIVAVRVVGDSLRRLWTQSAATLPPIVAGAGVWALGSDGTLYQLDPRTGRISYQASVGDPARFATPAAADGWVFVAAGGRVQAFG
jgi:outer membrane protein assembly factor BamB